MQTAIDPVLVEWFEALPETDQRQLIAEIEEELAREIAPLSFVEFVNQVTNGKYIWYDHCQQLAVVLQRVADGELKRVMVFEPPRHGKSELVSRLFSAYYLYRYPEKWIGLNSYGAELSYTFSRAARDNYRATGGILKDDAAAVKQWETDKGGGVWAAGVGGPITGKGFHLGIIDDPLKNSEEAASAIVRKRNEDWFDSTFTTREEPDAAIILIQTRWGKHDLAGYILDKEAEEPEHWHIVHFEAIKGDAKPKYPETCTLEPDPRQPGEALAPARYSLEKLKRIAKRIGKFFFDALYQQWPTLRQGRVYHAFDENCIVPYDSINLEECVFYHAHDFGAVNEAFGLFARDKAGVFYLVHEQILPEGTTSNRAGIVKSHFAERKVIRGWGGAPSEKQQRADYQAAGVRISEPPISDVEGGIDAVNRMLEGGTLKIASNMYSTIDQLENCVRDDKENIADKSKWHHLDVLRYLAAGEAKKRLDWGFY